MNKKILHLCSSSPITKSYIDFINENFGKENHFFVIFATSFAYEYPNNCLLITKKKGKFNYLKILLMLNKATKIILHGFFYNRFITRLLTISPWNIKKCYWVIWGGDLYDDVEQVEYTRTLKYKQFYFFKKWIIKKIRYYATYLEYDYQLAIKHYNSEAKLVNCIMYPSNVFTPLNEDLQQELPYGKKIKILLGNSASEANNHEEIIHLLANIKTQTEFIVYCPLSYGSIENAKRVKDLGRKMLGDRFIPMENFMPLNEYKIFLKSIAIAIFNHKRQEAMGNIINLLGLNKKIFIKNDVAQFALFKNLGLKFYKIEDLKHLDDLIKLTINNQGIIQKNFNLDTLYANWQEIFTTSPNLKYAQS